MHLPNRWGPGTIFGLSGIDAETDWAHPFLAAPESERIGLRFRVRIDPSLTKALDTGDKVELPGKRADEVSLLMISRPPLTPSDLDVSASIVSNELIVAQAKSGVRIFLVYSDKDTLIGSIESGVGLLPVLVLSDGSQVDSVSGDGVHLVLRTTESPNGTRFAVGFDWQSEENARERAEQGLSLDIGATAAKRRDWLEALQVPGRPDELEERAYRKACAILRVNCESPQGVIPTRWTSPDRWPHRNMWLWDSAFHAVGLRHFDPAMAEDAIVAKLAMVQDDGFMPHMTNPVAAEHSRVTQPPILGWAAEKVYEATQNSRFAEAIYEPLKRYVAWDLQNRTRSETGGLLGWHVQEFSDVIRGSRGGESGLDNSPIFDHVSRMTGIDFSCQVKREMDAIAYFAGLLGQAEEAEIYRGQAEALAAAINERLWDEETGFYYDADGDGNWIKIKAIVGFWGLWSGTASKVQAARMVEHLTDEAEFWRPMPVPTVAVDEPTYSDDCWRGPVWVNCNLMVIEGLLRYGFDDIARDLAERTSNAIAHWYDETGTIWEYYDPECQVSPGRLHRKGGVGPAGGLGFGVIKDYGWSAATFVELGRLFE